MSTASEHAPQHEQETAELTQFVTYITELGAISRKSEDAHLPEFFAPVPVVGSLTAII